mgnify:CR=1 FL=1
MAEKVDLSLDDIIKMTKKSNRGTKPNSKPNLQRLRNLGSRSGIIRKGGPRQTIKQQTPLKKELTMLHVSNLDWNVSTDDMRELFSDVGDMRKAVVHYDKSGRSLGTAEVTYTSREAAIRAIKKYNNQHLDGRPMNVTLVPNQSNVRSPAKNRSLTDATARIKPGSSIYKRSQTKSSKGGPNIKGRQSTVKTTKKLNTQRNQRQPKKQISAAELDADLEAYSANKMSTD